MDRNVQTKKKKRLAHTFTFTQQCCCRRRRCCVLQRTDDIKGAVECSPTLIFSHFFFCRVTCFQQNIALFVCRILCRIQFSHFHEFTCFFSPLVCVCVCRFPIWTKLNGDDVVLGLRISYIPCRTHDLSLNKTLIYAFTCKFMPPEPHNTKPIHTHAPAPKWMKREERWAAGCNG